MELWNDWLKWFDSQLKKKSILLIDNCPAHTDGSHLGLKNLHVIYLPPNTTSHIQPCDAGIIHNFKVNYRNKLVSKWIKDLEEENRINKINIKQAIDIVGEAWDAIKEETIKNCWKKTKILPPNKTVEITDDPTSNDILGLISGLREVNIDHAMTAEEFVNVDSDITTTELPTDENIIEDILISEEGKKVLEITKKFLEQQEFATEKDVRYVNELIKRLNSSVDKAKRQSLLTEFMNIDIE
ncbi:16499_t:CDS:2 [Entrophospora sp. SA101]|nr:16499_t:CDS:2 [Entrophospora sp. SA101]